MSQERDRLVDEIRYAERFCQRSARLYRRVQSVATFISIVSGGAAVTAAIAALPKTVSIVGGLLFLLFGAAVVVVRAPDKAAAYEQDMKRYAALRTRAHKLSDDELATTLDAERATSTGEIKALRDVVYNDVAEEIGQPSYRVRLGWFQRLIAAVA